MDNDPAEERSETRATPTLDEEPQLSSKPTCQVCTQIAKAFLTPYSETSGEQLGSVAQVLNSDCDHVTWMQLSRFRFISSQDAGVIVARKRVDTTSVVLQVIDHQPSKNLWKSNDIRWELLAKPALPQHPGRAIVVNTRSIDLNLLRSWIRRCCTEHKTDCEHPPLLRGLGAAQPRWLIDVDKGCVVARDSSTDPYITLSYTWGLVNQLRATKLNIQVLQQPEILIVGDLAAKIPDTVRDAIQLVRILGFKRLWVDSLCIVQDDEAELNDHLLTMHEIFANSLFTIVAASGNDANHGLRGLRGISNPRAMDQTVQRIGNGEAVYHCDHMDFIWGTGDHEPLYHDRAWTFQEFLLSKRRLYFRNNFVEWQCSSARWLEYLIPRPEADSRITSPEAWRTTDWIETRVPHMSCISALVNEYNQRKMRFPEDVLSAFSGIQSLLHALFPGGLIYGHPVFFLESSLLWFSQGNLKRREHSEKAFKPGGIKHIPSWSWMGWEGSIEFECDMEFEIRPRLSCGILEPLTQWYTLSGLDRNIKRLNVDWYNYKQSCKAQNTPLPAGWTKHRYSPPTWKTKRDKYRIPALPKQVPNHVYQHESKSSTRYWFRQYQFWYPVPVLDKHIKPSLREQTHYLFRKTRRVLLHAARVKGSSVFCRDIDEVNKFNTVYLRDETGRLAGSLNLHHEDQIARITDGNRRLELVAIAKGYTAVERGTRKGVSAEEDAALFADSEPPCPIRIPEASQDHSPSPSADTSRAGWHVVNDDLYSEDVRFEYWKEDKWNCYFVLYIEWEENVAYRRGSGFVLEEAWEKYKEEEPVEVILG
ncbi:heterokaryon incompatibility protein-domain-containing protein [Xylariaceae sp. FL1019]|nr:heterokaryon incompatibility protein-domain-containing protein [Xylariaceae sp. FL1019]